MKKQDEYIYPTRKELMESVAEQLHAAFVLAHVSLANQSIFMDELKVMTLAE